MNARIVLSRVDFCPLFHWRGRADRTRQRIPRGCMQLLTGNTFHRWWSELSVAPSGQNSDEILVLSASIVGQCYVCYSTYLHSQRLGISSCWTTAADQPFIQPTTVRPYPSAVPPDIADRRICLVDWNSST